MNLLVYIVARVLEGMFLVGALGSTIVLILSGIEDLKTLLGQEDKTES